MAEKEKSKLLNLLLGYERLSKSDGSRRTVGRRFYSRKISGRVTQQTKHFLDSGPMKLLRSLTDLVHYTSAKAYGVLFLTFGILSLVIQVVKDYFGFLGGSSVVSLIIGVCFALVSIPLLLADAPVSVVLQSFRPTEIIFFEFFCIKRIYYTGNERSLSVWVMAILGALLALVGLFAPLWIVAAAIGGLIFAALTFLSPEFCFFCTLLCLPYFSLLPNYAIIIGLVALLGVVSFIRKTIFGKRVIFFEQYDIIIGIFVAAVLLSGIFLGGISSFYSAVIMAAMTLGYFLASNTVTNRRLADCAINAVAISSLPAGIVSFVYFFVDVAREDGAKFIKEGISSTFVGSDTAAAFFIVAAVFSIILAKEAHRLAKLLYSVLAAVNLLALLLTGELFALLALLFALFGYFALKTKAWLALLLPILFVIPYLVFFIPESVLSALPSAIYEDGSLEVMRNALMAFGDNLLLGIGVGSESFKSQMANYGVLGRNDSGNLFLELGLEAGIFALGAFLLLLAVRLIHRAYYQRYVRHSHLGKLSPLVSVTIFALLVYGSFDYLFADMSMVYLFFSVFGIASASLRVAKQEHDDRVLYFEYEKSSTSSVVNIHIR